MIRVLIVDDHELLRAGLRSQLEREGGIPVVVEAGSVERAVIVARGVQPDLILLDLLPPRRDGYDAIPELADVAPQARVLVTFPGEIWQTPRSWVEAGYPTLTYFNEVDRGGHFAAWEEPELFSSELRAAFKSLR